MFSDANIFFMCLPFALLILLFSAEFLSACFILVMLQGMRWQLTLKKGSKS